MTDYNFETLNDMEFEELANDLISKKLDVFVERFKPGKDLGVDGRFFTPDGGEAIIQSKHYLKSGYDALLRHCKKTEADKVRKLNPTRYILFVQFL
ncbi:restriction endonuclease [Vibrio fortis]|uniref:Restriction endonuclease n=1 Tax=Vibrio fortis TaxID=212667 RepID=A0A5N3S2F4_9VIBR|nr:restriction endonuclease [Vibrio fortis]KAB0300799.1 restriction endonuclease [Vibrio fortis]